eukprot:5889614-Pyramimonas_sp.AAC.1
MRRRTEKGTTVLASLEGATSKQSLGHLMNASSLAHRNPDAPHMYGTTSLEAFMLQLKSFFRNASHQTRRNALIVCRIATVGKICGAYARTAFPGMNMREHEVLLSFCQNPLACDVD